MASIRKQPRSRYWYACFELPDGRLTQRTTKQTDATKARKIAEQFEKAAQAGKNARLTELQARKVMADIYSIANPTKMKAATTRKYLKDWLAAKEVETSTNTHQRYETVVTQFLRFIRTKADQDLFHLTTADLQAFRDELSGKLSRGSCNVAIKIMRAAFNEARTQGLMDSNPAQLVKLMRTEKFRRRPFTPDELRRVLAEADLQWKGMIAVALYTGFRLGDVASLDWQSINLDAAEISMVTGKTHRQMSIPIAAPLLRHLRSMENRSGPVFPEACETYQNSSTTSRLSKAFYRIMEKAGLVKHRTHESTGKGRSARRNQQELGFHALRHTATSLLKNANVSDAVARDIIGHETAAISASYTHIDLKTKREAVDRLPDFLN